MAYEGKGHTKKSVMGTTDFLWDVMRKAETYFTSSAEILAGS